MITRLMITCLLLSLLSPVLPVRWLSAAGVNDQEFAEWVSDRVKALQPTPSEKKFDEIGWVPSIVQAERLARQHNRPVFLFTLDGRMNTGRC